MKKFVIGAFAAIILLTTSLFAQENPVTWNFKTVKVNDSIAELQFQAQIQENWHLYSQYHNNGMERPIEFSFKPAKGYKRIGKVTEPQATVHYDPVFNDTSLYFLKSVTFKQKVQILQNEDFTIKGNISGQACIEGRCVALENKFTFDIKNFHPTTEVDNTNEVAGAENTQDTVIQNIENTAENAVVGTEESEESESLWSFFLVAFFGGLVGLLMPCVFPMIPMTVSYFMKQGKKAKLNALLYGLSIVIIYVIFGIILSLIFGPDFANILSTHWIPNLLFAVIFIIFALSFFGYFEITLPSSWVNKSAKMESAGGFIGIFFMALTLVLVSFSCTLPIAGAVALNSVGGSLLKPIIGMLGFSLGIAIPFTLFAFFPGLLKKMPKSGGWMNTLKVVLAFVELAFALKFINVPDQTYHWGILDREVYLALWIVLFSLLGFYLIGKIKFPNDDDMPVQDSPFRFTIAILTFAFVVYMIPGMFGAPLKAISGWLPPMTTQDFDVNQIVRQESGTGTGSSTTFNLNETPLYEDQLDLPHGIKGYFDYDQALRIAKEQNKPVFIDFTGHGCVNCRNVENAVWIDPQVRKLFAEEFVVVALYVDDKNIQLPEDQVFNDADGDPVTTLGGKNMYIQNTIYKENSQPCYFVIDPDGTVLAGPTYYEKDVNTYMDFLKSGIQAYKERHDNSVPEE
ncbi:MAG: thioredoxin family protein [Bacteroidales bacterium]|nr:thioredoxin family protein [Bacteroidales bacterium]